MTLSHLIHLAADLLATARNRALIKRSLGPIVARRDDHLLCDIGLTQHQAEALIRDPGLPVDTTRHLMAADTLRRSA